MPELPDLAIVADAFHAALAGRPVEAVATPDPIVLRATPARAATLVGQVVRRVDRRGKHLVIHLERDDLWAAPMLSGRFALAARGAARPRAPSPLALGSRVGSARRRQPAGPGGAPWLPADDDAVELRYLDPTRMGKLYLATAGDPAGVPGVAELGPDADDPALTLDAWRARIRRHPGELKALLRNQAFVAGLGNAYSDEILWAARPQPVPPAEHAGRGRDRRAPRGHRVDDRARPSTLLRTRVPPTFERQVRDHLKVHLRGGEPCPRCGAAISQVGRREATSYLPVLPALSPDQGMLEDLADAGSARGS